MIDASAAKLLGASSALASEAWPADPQRKADLAAQHYPFIWRSLRRLGVGPQAVDDAAQQVFALATAKLGRIAPGRERSFLFQTAVRVAMSVRRTHAQRREAMVGPELDAFVDPAPLPDAALEEMQQRRHLDALLDTLPMALRSVFVLYEIESLDSPAIAAILEIPLGTVASRLRRGRELFRRAAERMRKQLDRRQSR
jgi:RNA polymerase sigma-70 factor (ECF subfamily)